MPALHTAAVLLAGNKNVRLPVESLGCKRLARFDDSPVAVGADQKRILSQKRFACAARIERPTVYENG